VWIKVCNANIGTSFGTLGGNAKKVRPIIVLPFLKFHPDAPCPITNYFA
jgi:hypothetical protein